MPQNLNKAMRDPVCYRVNNDMPHPHTGNKYQAYPTYDFACPIVDSIDGVTHALRDRQFQDRNDQFQWFLDKMKLRQIVVWGFSRLNFQRCLLSKRKIQWFVDTKRVNGWDDARVPSIRGTLRRGLTVSALRKFVISQVRVDVNRRDMKIINVTAFSTIFFFHFFFHFFLDILFQPL
jgi:glutamyl-tRNA synthetase